MQKTIKPGGVSEYIARHPKAIQKALKEIRTAIQSAVPKAMETVNYFDMPGYSFSGYSYNGMFVWFSFKKPFVRLHVRPQALIKHKKDAEGYMQTKAVISFSIEKPIPKTLVKKLVKASLKDMKEMAK